MRKQDLLDLPIRKNTEGKLEVITRVLEKSWALLLRAPSTAATLVTNMRVLSFVKPQILLMAEVI